MLRNYLPIYAQKFCSSKPVQCYLFQTYAVVMHSPEFCNKIVKLTADDREIEVIEKGTKNVLYLSPDLNPV